MIVVRRDAERGRRTEGGVSSILSFREGDLTDPLSSGFHRLRNISEHRLRSGEGVVAGSEGEVLSYVVEGTVSSKLGACDEAVRAGAFELHALGPKWESVGVPELGPARLLEVQLWPGPPSALAACVQRTRFCSGERRGMPKLIASPTGRAGSLRLRQDTVVLSVLLDVGQHVARPIEVGRHTWVHVIRGGVRIAPDLALAEGDGAGLSGEHALSFTAHEVSELLLIEMGWPSELTNPSS
jgi:redox-sensitive bicupin YhaK (pirin superfamily)